MISRQIFKAWLPLAFLLMVVLSVSLTACSALPSLAGRTASTYIQETGDTRLGRAAASANAAPGTSGVFALSAPMDAFAVRVLLMRTAERSLDIQYYIWHADITGRLLLDEVLRAANRGVRVRLLLDDNGISGLDADLASLGQHPNIEVRVFNPFAQRRFKALGYLTDFGRVNHRMHNKSLTADAQATLVGGRNIGDAYFGADPILDFADVDLLAVGPVTKEVSTAFDAYWNSELAYPFDLFPSPATKQALESLAARYAELNGAAESQSYVEAVRPAEVVERLVNQKLPLAWVPVQLVYDPPAKAQRALEKNEALIDQLVTALGGAQSQLDIVSPYFVPGQAGTDVLVQEAQRGLKIRVVTNSLASTDVIAVHAGYAKRRQALLKAGVRLFEIKPDAQTSNSSEEFKVHKKLIGSSAASLHGKTYAVDRRSIFIGSFNLDLRSIELNTEMGLVVESATLAGGLSDLLDKELSKHAYEVRLTSSGALEWIEQTETGDIHYSSEPKAGVLSRLGVVVMSWLPIEGLL